VKVPDPTSPGTSPSGAKRSLSKVPTSARRERSDEALQRSAVASCRTSRSSRGRTARQASFRDPSRRTTAADPHFVVPEVDTFAKIEGGRRTPVPGEPDGPRTNLHRCRRSIFDSRAPHLRHRAFVLHRRSPFEVRNARHGRDRRFPALLGADRQSCIPAILS